MAEELTVWSPIRYHHPDQKRLVVVKQGKKITKDHPAVKNSDDPDATWKEWQEAGVLRKTEWPEGLDPDNPNAISPNAHRARSLRLERERLEAEMSGVGGVYEPGNTLEVEDNQAPQEPAK